jgi:hypothetical protein
MNYVSSVVIVLFLLTLAAALMMIMAIYGIIQSSNAYTDITQQTNKQNQTKAIHDSGLPFPKYIHQISMGAGNPKNTSALADYKAIQNYMQTIEKSISICDNKKYDYISASDQGFKNCMDMTAFVYETCSGDSSIYKSVCNNAIIEGILKTTNPSVQDLR